MNSENSINRRMFLKHTAVTAASVMGVPYLVRASALGKNGNIAASNRITIGCIGVGGMGTRNMSHFLEDSDAHVVAVCDVDQKHREAARERVNKKYKNKDCACYNDFRELIARDDIDAVSIATPDHWHAIPAIAAAKAGKDIYGEKPLSHNLAEGRAMCDAVKRYNRVWQTGSWQRSVFDFRFACELVVNGRIGRVYTVEVGLPSGHDANLEPEDFVLCPPPDELDYDFWLGAAPYAPYCPARVHKNWRWILDYGGGQLMDWVGHHVDIAHWGLGLDYSGPEEIEGYGEYPRDGLWNSPTKYHLTAKYANGITMIIAGGYDDIRSGTRWIGEYGWVWVNRGGIDAQPKSLLEEKIHPDEINLYHSDDHRQNFLDCIKSRRLTITPAEVAHRSASVGHIGQIAMELGRKLKWDAGKERFINDPEADSLLSRSMRSPWYL